MKNLPELLILGILLVTFTTVANLGNAFGSGNEVHIEAGAGSENSGKGFVPKELVVDEGTTVKWVNDDTQGHSITSGRDSTDPDSGKLFDSAFPLIKAGAEWEHTFDKTGSFPYFCQVHPWMHGIVYVPTYDFTRKDFDLDQNLSTDKSIGAFVTISDMPLQANKEIRIGLQFIDPATNQQLQNVNYDLKIKDRSGNAVVDLKGLYVDSGTDSTWVRFNSTGSYTLSINVTGTGIPPGPLDRTHSGFTTISLDVVPEFPGFGLIVFATAISLILAASLTLKTRLRKS